MTTKFNSFAIILQPYHGITHEIINKIEKYILKQCDYYLVITEPNQRGGQHLHAALFLDRKMLLKDFNSKIMKRNFCKLLDEKSIWKVAYKGKNLYNDDWVSNYLTKDDNRTVLYTKLPPMETRQEYYQDVDKKSTKKITDYYYNKLETLWKEWAPANCASTSLNDINIFLHHAMYKDRTINVIADPRKQQRIANALRCYVTRGECKNALYEDIIYDTRRQREHKLAMELSTTEIYAYNQDVKDLARRVIEHNNYMTQT